MLLYVVIVVDIHLSLQFVRFEGIFLMEQNYVICVCVCVYIALHKPRLPAGGLLYKHKVPKINNLASSLHILE
jgi:hypothetical protein